MAPRIHCGDATPGAHFIDRKIIALFKWLQIDVELA